MRTVFTLLLLATINGSAADPRIGKWKRVSERRSDNSKPSEVTFAADPDGMQHVTYTTGLEYKATLDGQEHEAIRARGFNRVSDLRRTAFGPLLLGNLKEGHSRRLSAAEVEELRRAAGGGRPSSAAPTRS